MPFDMTVLNRLDRVHLVGAAIDRLPQTGSIGRAIRADTAKNLAKHTASIARHGEDMPEVRHGRWDQAIDAEPGRRLEVQDVEDPWFLLASRKIERS